MLGTEVTDAALENVVQDFGHEESESIIAARVIPQKPVIVAAINDEETAVLVFRRVIARVGVIATSSYDVPKHGVTIGGVTA